MLQKLFFYSALILLSVIACVLIISNLSFLLNFNINIPTIYVSIFLSIILVGLMIRNWKDIFTSFIITIPIILVCYFLSINFFDISYDGQGYHQETIYLLKNGWNPVFEEVRSSREWINFYQKGNEIIQANIYFLTDKIESSKIINLIFIYITFIIFFNFLDLLKIKFYQNLIISFIVIFNPIVFTQIFTNYVDANWYLTLVISLSSLLAFYINKKVIFGSIYILSSVIFCSLKFSSIPIFIVFTFFTGLYYFLTQKKILIKPYIIIFLLGVVCNIHPFFTNVRKGLHVFHPFAGEKRIDILNQNIPEVLLNHNRLERLLISLFSRSNNNRSISLINTLKIPFSIDKKQLFLIYDTRLGGFGFLFSGIILIATLISIYWFWHAKNSHHKKEFAILLMMLFCSILINPASWWARLSPQIWLIPIVIIIFACLSQRKITKIGAKILLFLFLANISIPSLLTFNDLIANQKKMNEFINSVGSKTIFLDTSNQFGFRQYHLKFKENKINYKIIKMNNQNKIAPFTKDVYYKIE